MDDVELPAWASSPEEFVRQVFYSNYTENVAHYFYKLAPVVAFFRRARMCLLLMSPIYYQFLRDVWIRTQRVAVVSTHLPTHLPKLAIQLPDLATNLPKLATHLPDITTHLPYEDALRCLMETF